MTTKDAIKMLPLEDTLKTQVLNMYDYMEPDQKLTVAAIAWKTYFLMHEERVEINMEKELAAVEEGSENLGTDLYERVLKKTVDQEKALLADKSQSADLAAARRAMEQIINEIRASKKAPKTKH